MEKKKPSGISVILSLITVILSLILTSMMIYTDTSTINHTQQEIIERLSDNVGSPTWIIIVSIVLIILLGISWYIGAKKKFTLLGDKNEQS
jgi:hypothetical protein